MSRLPRLVVTGLPHLIIQRGLQSQSLFADDRDRDELLVILGEAARACRVAVHAYVLLDSEVQLVATPADAMAMSRFMQSIGRRYVSGFNRRHHRSGTLWQGRYRATVIEPETHLLACMRFVETRPLLVGAAPADYTWSSARHHLGRGVSSLVTEHPLYWQLGNTPFDREARYRAQLEQMPTMGEAAEIENAALKGWALGSERFMRELEQLTPRRVRPLGRGRPRKGSATAV